MVLPTTWLDFKKLFLENFVLPDTKIVCESELSKLKQTGSVSEYNLEFQRLVGILQYREDSSLMFIYKRGLSKEIHKRLLGYPEPSTLKDLSKLCIRIDARKREYGLFVNHNVDNVVEQDDDPMEIGEMGTTTTSNEDSCFVCRSKEHRWRKCPKVASLKAKGQ
jgi:hypothetical protein